VASPLSHLGRRYACIEPERHPRVPKVVRPSGER
jgi:hypothetical protein